MRVRLLDGLRAVADVTVDPARRLPFDAVRSEINLKRLGLVCWLGLVNEACEITVAAAFQTWAYLLQVGLNMVIFGATIAFSGWARRQASPRLRALATPVFATIILLMWQSSIAVLAQSGRLSTSYPMILLVVALVFVWPPRVLAIVMAGTCATFVVVVLQTPAPAFEQSLAIRTALLSALVAVVAGILIHQARQRDYLMTLALHARNEELQQRNVELDEVMAFAAHDLRSPLLGLRNLLAFARPRIASDGVLAGQTMDEAARSVAGMLALIGRLLEAHEAEHGRMRLTIEDLRSALTSCADRNRASAETVGVELVLDLPQQAVLARSDRLALQRILDNLVSNAVRFSQEGSAVTLACSNVDGIPRLSVADQGAGVAPGDRARLFEKFGRPQTSSLNGTAGTGLGLFIASVLTKRMGASLTYYPRNPTGSVFEAAWKGSAS